MRAAFACGLALIFVAAGAASAIDVNGGSSWAGWTLVGNSQNSGASLDDQLDGLVPLLWAGGTGSVDAANSFDVYTAQFTWDGTELYTGANDDYTYGTNKSNTAGVRDYGVGISANGYQSWQAGDRILAIGSQSLGNTYNSCQLELDFLGGGQVEAASYRGATDGVPSLDHGEGVKVASAGDIMNFSDFGGGDVNWWKAGSYNVFTDGSTTAYKDFYGNSGGTCGANPIKSFAIMGTANTRTTALSHQVLVNLDALQRDEALVGTNTLGTSNVPGAGETVSIAMGQFPWGPGAMAGHSVAFDVTIVPEPATMALLGFGGLALLRRRRR